MGKKKQASVTSTYADLPATMAYTPPQQAPSYDYSGSSSAASQGYSPSENAYDYPSFEPRAPPDVQGYGRQYAPQLDPNYGRPLPPVPGQAQHLAQPHHSAPTHQPRPPFGQPPPHQPQGFPPQPFAAQPRQPSPQQHWQQAPPQPRPQGPAMPWPPSHTQAQGPPAYPPVAVAQPLYSAQPQAAYTAPSQHMGAQQNGTVNQTAKNVRKKVKQRAGKTTGNVTQHVENTGGNISQSSGSKSCVIQ